MALEDYLVSEIALDHADGLLSRRDAIRKLVLLGLTAAAAAVTLDAPASAAAKTTKRRTSRTTTTTRRGATTTRATTTTLAPVTTTTGPPTSTTGRPAATAGAGEEIRFAGPAGTLIAVMAAAAQPKGAVLIVHENRGLTDHFRVLPTRFAGDGYTALSIDLASRVGGTAAVAAQMPGPLGAISTDDLVADAKAGLGELAKRAPDQKLAVIGFCFGGGMVWSLLQAGVPRLAAAVPFYGVGPAQPDFRGSKNAAVLAVYAELDSRVNANRDSMTEALRAAGLVHEVKTFPGVDHAFFNDTGARYDATQAKAAYAALLAWFARHLA